MLKTQSEVGRRHTVGDEAKIFHFCRQVAGECRFDRTTVGIDTRRNTASKGRKTGRRQHRSLLLGGDRGVDVRFSEVPFADTEAAINNTELSTFISTRPMYAYTSTFGALANRQTSRVFSSKIGLSINQVQKNEKYLLCSSRHSRSVNEF